MISKFKRIRRLIFFITLILFSVQGSAWGEGTKIKVLQQPYLGFAPFFIAEDGGYFAEQGLEVEFVRMKRSSLAVPLLVQGKLDVIGGTNSFSIYNAMAQGADIKVVAGRGSNLGGDCVYTGIMVRKGLGFSMQNLTADQLRGRRVAINLKSSTAYFFERFLKRYGLSLKDVVIVDVENSVKAEAFKNKSIDFTHAGEPWVTRLVRSGYAEILLPDYEASPDYDQGLLLFGPSFIQDNRETGLRFMRAYLKAFATLAKGKTDRNIEIISKYTGLDPDFLKDACWPTIKLDGSVNLESIQLFMQWGIQKGHLDRVLAPEEFWDPSFIRKAAEQ